MISTVTSQPSQPSRRHALLAQALLLGTLTGLLAVAFHLALNFADEFRNRVFAQARHHPIAEPWILVAMAILAAFLGAGVVMRFGPEAGGSGIPHLKAVLLGRCGFRWARTLVIKFLSTTVAVAGGLVLGREGPSVHMGGAIGQGIVNIKGARSNEERRILVGAGGGAGLAAAFNAPLAGLIFVLEELEWRFGSPEFFTAAVACLASDMVCRAFLGQYPTYHLTVTGAPPLDLTIVFVPLGVTCAVFGGLFSRLLIWSQCFVALKRWAKFGWWVTLALLIAGVGWWKPDLLGGGEPIVDKLLEGSGAPLRMAIELFSIRFLLTIASSSSGAAGGIFTPVLVLGALSGWAMAACVGLLFPALAADPKVFAVVGMAAFFTGVVGAPLTGIVLIIEMTGNYELVMPLFTACFTTLLISDWIGNLPIYEAWLENDIKRGRYERFAHSSPKPDLPTES